MKSNAIETYQWLPGIVILVGSAQFALSQLIEELLIPKYNPLTQAISDLGNGSLYGQTALIFNISLFLLGASFVISTLLLTRILPSVGHRRLGVLTLGIAGFGAITSSLSPENVNLSVHGLGALVAFLFYGIAFLALAQSSMTILNKRWISTFMKV